MPPLSKISNIFLSSLIGILSSISESIYIITGNALQEYDDKDKVHIYSINYKIKANTFTKVMNYIYLQLRFSYMIMKLKKKVSLWIFFSGGDAFLLTILTVKLLSKKVVLMLGGSFNPRREMESNKLSYILPPLRRIACHLSDNIIIYSKKLVKEWSLQKHISKISIARRHFVDFDKFRMEKKLSERDDFCGYIGILEKWKGILEFTGAIPKILEKRKDVKFSIVGDGKLRDEVKKCLDINNLNYKVKVVGWIPHDELPKYLNELKLLVLPSYTEGLPNIMLETMVCGTPVLATSVGAIPDIIKDGKTGFIMENNTSECIAKNVIRALEHPDLDRIAENARKLASNEFTYEAAVERCRKVLENFRQ